MKITVSTKSLRAVIEKMAGLPTGLDTSMQAMVVSITADIEGLRVQRIATSCGISLDLEDVEVEEEGICYVSLDSLRLTAKSSDEKIRMETDGKFLRVSAASWKATLKVIDSPEIIQSINSEGLTKELDQGKIDVGMQDLVKIFERVAPAADVKGMRDKGLFKSVSFIPSQNGVTVTGTDARRFHFETVQWAVKEPVIIPLECEGSLCKIIGKEDGRISLEIGEGSIRATGPGFKVFFPLFEPRFPNLGMFLNISSWKSDFTCNREELKNALSSALPFNPDATVSLTSGERKLCIASTGQTEDRYDTSIKCKHDGSMNVFVNATYLLEAISMSRSESVTVMRGEAGIDVIAIKEGASMAVIGLIRLESQK